MHALKKPKLSDADHCLLLRYALFPRVRGLVDGKPQVVDVMKESEAEITKTTVAEGPIPQPTSMTVMPGLTKGPTIVSGSCSHRRRRLSMK